jgi:DNA-binding MarR family transcriptional regulator
MDRVDASLIALRRILRATDLFARDLKRVAGVTAVQFRVLQIIAETGQTTAKAISVQMRVSQATVTSLVDKLVRDGLARREKSMRDRRQTDIHITDLGRRVLAEAPDPLQQRFVRKFSAMEDWEQAMLVASLERVAAMLDAEDIDAAPVLHTGDIKAQGGDPV